MTSKFSVEIICRQSRSKIQPLSQANVSRGALLPCHSPQALVTNSTKIALQAHRDSLIADPLLIHHEAKPLIPSNYVTTNGTRTNQ